MPLRFSYIAALTLLLPAAGAQDRAAEVQRPSRPLRLEDGVHHKIEVTPPVEIERTGELERDVRVAVARGNRALEHFIRRWPEQYFGWLHRRWKTPPPPGEPIYDADGNRLDRCAAPAVPSPA